MIAGFSTNIPCWQDVELNSFDWLYLVFFRVYLLLIIYFLMFPID